QRNNLDHLEFLKLRLGMQVFVSNLAKTIVVYGISILCHIFLYTLTVHLSYYLIRQYAHGAHAKSSLSCHIQNIVLFVLLPWFIRYIKVDILLMYTITLLGFIIFVIFMYLEIKKQ